jgi:hypothetical protein
VVGRKCAMWVGWGTEAGLELFPAVFVLSVIRVLFPLAIVCVNSSAACT